VKMMIDFAVEVNIEGDRVNANEIFRSVKDTLGSVSEQLALQAVQGYQDRIVELLCTPSGSVAKKGLGRHEKKGEDGVWCRHRRFERAGYWGHTRRLRGETCAVKFQPAMVKCLGCGKRLTPVLEALELEPYQRATEGLVKQVMEAVADTSYRRGEAQLEVLGEVPVAKSTMHQWAASVEVPVSEGQGEPFVAADGTGFKRQPGQRGEVRLVLEIGPQGAIHPLGVWAGTSWEDISKELKHKRRQQGNGQYELFLGDGEQALEDWLGGLAERANRCHWHVPRGGGYALWEDGVPLGERRKIQGKLGRLLAIEIPEEDLEAVSEEDQAKLREQIESAENELEKLREEFVAEGYTKAATYLANTRDRLFNHLRLWLETGIIAPRTTSIVENTIRELVRRLKKIGYNWSDAGATRMGRIVMLRRYDAEGWHAFWKERMNLQGRCQMQLVSWDRRVA
jgi:transposase-like protein